MDFMSEQKKYNEGIKKLNKSILEDSYSRTFFNDAFQNSYDIYLKNRENPAKFDLETTAYTNGISSEIPEESKEKTLKPIVEFNNSLKNDSLRNFANNTIAKANESTQMSRIKAGFFATQSFKDRLPNDAQMQLDANYFADIDRDYENGDLTREEALKLKEIHEINRFVYALEPIIRDRDINYEEKQALITNILNGETGNEFIDKMPEFSRLELLTNITSKNRQLDEYEENLKRKEETQNKNRWEENLLNMYNYASFNGDPRILEQMIAYQKATAATYEDYKRVDDVYTMIEGKTNPKIKLELDNALSSGALDKQQKLDLVYKSRDFLSTTDYQKMIENINNPVAVEMEKQDVKIAQAEAKAKYGYTPIGKNDAYDWFNYALQRNLAAADTPEKRKTAVKDAFDETDRMFKDRILSASNVEEKRMFVEKYQQYNLTPEGIVADIDSETINLAKQATKKKIIRMSEAGAYKEQAKANVIYGISKQNNLTYQDATLIVEEAIKIENMGK